MHNEPLLLEVTESYLKALIGEVCNSPGAHYDSLAPFRELAIDSFHVLKIIKRLEGDFGALPKTLLFEHFNVRDLAGYFVERHRPVLIEKFALPVQEAPPAVAPAQAEPFLVLEERAWGEPGLQEIVAELFEAHKSEGSVSRGTRIIAPNLFFGSERRGYLNYARCNRLILVYAFTGPEDYFPIIAREMLQYCTRHEFQLNILADRSIDAIGEVEFSATPFGALQRVGNLRDFALEGGAMRRLRYQVSRFEKAGVCRTSEYRCGTDPATDRDIIRVIEEWCAPKAMVNPLVHIVKAEILAGTLHSQHRVFLTYVDDVLHNVILISALSATLNGYLMDLEFYTQSMPLGGLEFAIVRIIEKLIAEGCDLLSLGGTYGCKLEPSSHADPEVDRILDDLRKQGIFNDQGNLQFKNKFRPENRAIYLCRPVGSGQADNVLDIIMMIADPQKMQTSDEEHHSIGVMQTDVAPIVAPATSKSKAGEAAHVMIEGVGRSLALAQAGFNPLCLPAGQVEIDFKTDSWAQLKMPAIEARMSHLRSQLPQPIDVMESLKGVFPFTHFLLTASGRAAEHILYKAWPTKGTVLQNLLFPTGIFHQIDNGFSPGECPDAEVFRLGSQELFKGNLAWGALKERVAENPKGIAFACIEVGNNAAGGYPVSMQHLKSVKSLLAEHSIPLVIDATRVVENARFLIEREPECAGRELWSVVREMLSCADVVTASLAKDFCVDHGGLIATHDTKLFRRLQSHVQEEGSGLDLIDRKLIAHSLKNCSYIETQVAHRMAAVTDIWNELQAHSIPVVQPAGGHCVVIDVKQIEELREFEYPVASFLAWLYLNTGIRAGAHSVGMQKRTSLDDLVRLAIPVGVRREQVESAIRELVRLFEQKANIPELVLEGSAGESFGELSARYRLKKYHNPSGRVVPAAVQAAPAAIVTAVTPPPVKVLESVTVPLSKASDTPVPARIAPPPDVADGARAPKAIAIVGMAGRYPKAKNMEELWDNLAGGRDCIEDLPASRYEQRLRHRSLKRYRGGFIDDIDSFDSLFFSISPREAQMLDPQERLFLEVAWEALEDGGYYPESLSCDNAQRNIGVFVGAVWTMYQMLGVEEKRLGNQVTPNSFLWSIANRVSYAMNLSGPSITLDTACSSSLTALYLACEAIQTGECSAAIVGGVNLDLHQGKFDINQAGGALSKDGVCRSFGRGANGYVAGEGVGALFLKPLDEAIRQGDNIHGVIKSIVVNHGGRTSGYTVPNPKAQTALVLSALEKGGIDARSVGYIEAHGTGTELGDPIEITGLTKAFQTHRVENAVCAIGSVKSNLGHLEAAAGVVSVSKVLLQMKHRRLVPSLHCAELNEFIEFAHSPFVVQQTQAEWRPKEVDGVTFPLRAGISSFGAGGSNAHLILESYTPPAPLPDESTNLRERVFPLSARNDDQLRQMALRLRESLQRDLSRSAAGLGLDDIAYTLQIGRKSFDCRLAIIARTKDELIGRLTAFLEGKGAPEILAGGVKNAEGITRMLNGPEKEEFIRLLRERRDPSGIARLWVEGLLADWQSFGARGRRVSLPTYPFAVKRHWVWDLSTTTPLTAPTGVRVGLHPLIDSNQSTFERQLFKKTFHDGDFFIHDHHVSGIPTLPGVAYLELVRVAGEMAAGRKVRKIRNILWLSPIAVRDSIPREVVIELKPAKEGAQFEVYSEDGAGTRTLHSQGKLVYVSGQEVASAEYVDIASVRAKCAPVIEGSEAYPLFKSFGLGLGPSFQVLKEVFKSDKETLGVLSLPASRHGDLQQMILHPSLVDGALQAGVAAHLRADEQGMVVPFSIGEVEILQPLQPDCLSYVTSASDAGNEGSRVSRTHISILDPQGQILVRIRDSVGVPLREVHKQPSGSARSDEFSRLYYRHRWEKSPLPAAPAGSDDRAPVLLFATDEFLRRLYRERLKKAGAGEAPVILVQPGECFEDLGEDSYRVNPGSPEDFTQLLEALTRKQYAVERICFGWPLESAVRKRGRRDTAFLHDALRNGVYSLLFLCQALMKQATAGNVQLLYVYTSEEGESPPHHEAVNGFAKALHLEHPRLRCKTLEFRQPKTAFDRLLDAVLAEFHPQARDTQTIRYDDQERYVRKLDAIDLEDAPTGGGVSLREGGAYLITGGAGGLGLLFAEFLAKKHKARLVLTGRSKLSAAQEGKLDELRKLGARVLYLQADVSDREAVRMLLEESRRQYGALNGIIHAAGVLRDSYIRNKTSQQMEAVLAPKIHGTLHIDELSQGDELDFLVLFSSLAAVGGNAGQCDYCFANHFMDSFAVRRERLRADGARRGKTLSLNWSLWADGGMQLDEQTGLFFKKTLGIKPLETEAGLDAFVRGLASANTQLAVLEGVQQKIELAWGMRPPAAAVKSEPQSRPESPAAAEDDELLVSVQNELSRMVVDFLKLESSDVALDSVLLDLGFDSMGLASFANAINEKYQLDITPVLFFDYPAIAPIAKYLCTQRPNEVAAVHSKVAAVKVVRADSPEEAPIEIRKGAVARATSEAANVGAQAVLSPERRFIDRPIAIVGMSGVMPQSQDLEEFWEHLQNGRDLISEIPRDRWRWEDYYGDPLKEVNKSNSKWGGFMREVDKFDPLFFGISPREAQMMDPQQRIFLETVWKAVEDSGQKVSDLAGTRTGLFVGVATNDYIDLMHSSNVGLDGYTASGNSHSVLANRVSFLLNLRGPSAPLDTACSSSLVAIHRAIESIHSGSCDMAIVGGVQVMLTPAAYISFGIAGMLSSDGKCKAFDKRANGYVRGEGAGAIFLKSLAQAEADGNHIYAVIKATAENHGGRVTTLTAPNSSAQQELLVEAYGKAQVDPTTVGYIECHGTGTGLGDPIEIQALTKSFAELYSRYGKAPPETPHCGLSSVKTNIGHLETAAGIAGILKALLAIKHRQIPANVHFEELNPYINLKASPFFIADKTRPWAAPTGADGAPLPRRAGVSSFGFGGANAHIVLEEYIRAPEPAARTLKDPCLVVLSARNEERLKAYAQRMLAYLETREVNLADFAHTLQVGRDEMAERLALVVSSVEELRERFQEFLRGDPAADNGPLYRARARNKKGESRPAPVSAALPELAKLWVSGVSIDWRALHGGAVPKRISLPTYPFARERYWIAAPATHTTPVTTVSLHPLIHTNTSTLKEQRFSSRFSGEEFYLADHVVETQKILPGVAYLEMARVAGELAGQQPVRVLRNIVWERPLIIGSEPKDVEVILSPTKDEVAFSVRSAGQERSTPHCSGKLAYVARTSEPERVDLAGIQRRCAQEVLTGTDLYPLLDGAGLKLGPSFRIVEKIFSTPSESLAVLKLPAHLQSSAGQYGLHPALMDGSLHTAIGLMKCSGLDVPLRIPYSLGEVQIFAPLTELRYGYATWETSRLAANSDLPKVTFQLLDAAGRVLVRIKDLVTRSPLYSKAAPAAQRAVGRTKAPAIGRTCYHMGWQRQPLPAAGEAPASGGRYLVFEQAGELSEALGRTLRCDSSSRSAVVSVRRGPAFLQKQAHVYEINPAREADYEALLHSLSQQSLLPEHIVHGWSRADFATDDTALKASLLSGVYSLLHLSRALTRISKESQARTARTRLIYVYPTQPQALQPQHAAISAFAKSAMLEDSRLLYTCLGYEDEAALVSRILEEIRAPGPTCTDVRYSAGERWVAQVMPVELPTALETGLRERGVYLITGGLGGLGLIFARFLARNARARLVLASRSPANEQQQSYIRELESLGSEVLHCQVDVASLAAVEGLVASAVSRFGTLDGVLHCAGVLRDALILKKTAADLDDVFAAKIHGTVNLDAATQKYNLDFFALFSSLTAVTGNAGQCDYAYANSFLDHFAQWRNDLQRRQQRSGKTLSVNWPLWKEGGMRIPEQMEAFLEESLGIQTLDTETGLAAFRDVLATDTHQLLVMKGVTAKIHRMLGITVPQSEEPPQAQAPRSRELSRLLREDLMRVVKEVLLISEREFATDVDMSEYGLDSISLAKFFNEVNGRYSLDLTPAVFFEYPTFDAFAGFLLQEHPAPLSAYFERDLRKAVPRAELPAAQVQSEVPPPAVPTRFQPSSVEAPADTAAPIPVAVVGMSGVFPQSENLQAFWENLAAERDLITEIPADRWDWRAFQGNPFEERNKTNSKWGGFLKEVDKFDNAFFGITPFEAQLMDPQKRIFLETVWKAIEDSGHKPSELAGTRTGVFVGVAGFDYLELLRDNKVDVVAYTATGMSHCVLPNRISYMLDIHGPSEPVDTACSSSLIAIHRAAEAITSGNCEMAIAGGVSLLLSPSLYVAFGNAGMLSSDGRCKTFDRRADGYVRGEGSGAVFLKRLDKAVADGDHIYAVIKGSAVNHGGRATSLTAPNPNAQAELLVEAYEKARVDPNTVGYIEAHGTGTALGDPVEINGLKKAFKELHRRRNGRRSEGASCAVGSVKTNIGHLEMAAGIAGFIKAVLSVQQRVIPGNIHYQELNPHIRLEDSPFYIAARTHDWPAPRDENGIQLPRTAGVSSFGFGGANAHVIVQEYSSPVGADEPDLPVDDDQLAILLSARTPAQVEQRAGDLLLYLRGRGPIGTAELRSVAYTLQVGREAMPARVGFLVRTAAELSSQLEAFLAQGDKAEGIYRGQLKDREESVRLISQDADLRETILEKWLTRKKLSGLVELWVKGIDFDWSRIYGEIKPRRISLPTYPFSRDRCWFEPAPASRDDAPPAAPKPHKQVERLKDLLRAELRLLQEGIN